MGRISKAIGKPKLEDMGPASEPDPMAEPAGDGGEEAAFRIIMRAVKSGDVKAGTSALKDFIEICTSSGEY